MLWGVAGPHALTALAAEEGLTHWALPPSIFYPLHYTQAERILDPRASLADIAANDSIAVGGQHSSRFIEASLPCPDASRKVE